MITTAVLCLSQAVYYEARGEPLEGQLAVAQVIVNRKNSARWPNTICEVVHQPMQFSFTYKLNNFSMPDKVARETAIKVASWTIIMGIEGVNADHYFNPKITTPIWASRMRCNLIIGNHKFCISDAHTDI